MPKTTQDKINQAIQRMFPNAKHILIDYDGTIADTEKLNYAYWVKTYGIDTDKYPLSQYKEEFLDAPYDEIDSELRQRHGKKKKNIPYEPALLHLADKTHLAPYEYLTRLLREWTGDIILISQAPQSLILKTAEKLGLSDTITEDNSYSATDDNTTIPEYRDILLSMGDITKDQNTIIITDNPKTLGRCKREGYATIGIEHGQSIPEDMAHFIIITKDNLIQQP